MPSPFEGLLPRYDAVVIGAGLGGMTAANNLAKFGRKVLLLEHHYQLGGLATFFKRAGGHVFDISLHGFPHGMIKSTRRYWTKDISDRIHQLKDVRFINPDFDVRTTFDREDFTRILIEKFRLPAETVEAFFAHLRAMNYYDNDPRTTRELFEQFFPAVRTCSACCSSPSPTPTAPPSTTPPSPSASCSRTSCRRASSSSRAAPTS